MDRVRTSPVASAAPTLAREDAPGGKRPTVAGGGGELGPPLAGEDAPGGKRPAAAVTELRADAPLAREDAPGGTASPGSELGQAEPHGVGGEARPTGRGDPHARPAPHRNRFPGGGAPASTVTDEYGNVTERKTKRRERAASLAHVHTLGLNEDDLEHINHNSVAVLRK